MRWYWIAALLLAAAISGYELGRFDSGRACAKFDHVFDGYSDAGTK